MPENGPRVDLERRIATLESQMRIVAYIGGAALTGIITLIVLVTIGVLTP